MKNKINLLNLFLEIGILKKVQRTGWVLKGVKDAESVAEHTWRVALLTLILALDFKVDQLRAVKMALVHDLGETLIGDIKWETGNKVIGSKAEKHKDEQKAIEKMFSDNPNFKEYIDLWKEFEEQKTKESRFVKQLDKLEMVLQAYEYEKDEYPPKWFNEFWENAEKYLKGQELEPIFRQLQKMRQGK